MVVDTAYYDALQVPPNASELDIKKAYRKLAVKLHPDKNPGDEDANKRFQTIGEAYQVLSDPQLRAAYDKYGKDKAVPSSGFEDPAEFFSMIFGGEVFVDWIGEISLMKDLTHTMDISMREEAEEQAQAAKNERSAAQDSSASNTGSPNVSAAAAGASTTTRSTDTPPPNYKTTSGYMAPPESEMRRTSLDPASSTTSKPSSGRTTPSNPYSQDRPKGVQTRLAITDRSEEDAQMSAAGVTEGEKELRAKEKKKGGLTKEQREELRAYEIERQRVRDERVNNLARKLIDRISVWTETDKGRDVTTAFREKTRLEVENLKMESFGLEILHAIGTVYVSKATAVLKSQKMFGIGGFWSRLKDKGAIAKETWGTISTAIDAQMSMEAMAKAEELGGDEWTDERRAEHEARVTGKILAAAWRGSKMEIMSVLRDVCDQVLGDKKVRMEKRVERAQALVLMGELLRDAKRDPDEEGEYLVFERIMAEAMAKKEKEKDKDKDKKKAAKGAGKEDGEKEKEKVKDGAKGHFGFGTQEKEKVKA